MLKRLLVTLLSISLLFSGTAVSHSHALDCNDDHTEHGSMPHLHAHALLDWFADHDEHDADHEHEHVVEHSKNQEQVAEQSGLVTVHSMSSTTTSEHDDDALYVVADRTAAERIQTAEHFKPVVFAVVADVGRSLQRNQFRLCHDLPPPISIVPIYVRMLSLRI